MMKRFDIKKRVALFFLILLVPLWAATAGIPEITPDKALDLLKEGNARFVQDKPEHPRGDLGRRQDTDKNGQHPYATILSCSDSRVPPEWIFDAGIGDIFVVRVAGNVSETDEIGTIEYGTEHLKTPLLVVMGHAKCGAVTAVVKGDKVGGSIPELVKSIVPVAKRFAAGKEATPEVIDIVIRENVWQSIHNLLRRSAIVRELVKKDELKIVGAYYHTENGSVEWLGEFPGQATFIDAVEHQSAMEGFQIPWLGLTISILILLLNYLLFVGETRLFKWVRIKGRLYSAFIGLPLAMIAGYMYSDRGMLSIVLLAVITILAVLFYGASILGTFRKVIRHYKGTEK